MPQSPFSSMEGLERNRMPRDTLAVRETWTGVSQATYFSTSLYSSIVKNGRNVSSSNTEIVLGHWNQQLVINEEWDFIE